MGDGELCRVRLWAPQKVHILQLKECLTELLQVFTSLFIVCLWLRECLHTMQHAGKSGTSWWGGFSPAAFVWAPETKLQLSGLSRSASRAPLMELLITIFPAKLLFFLMKYHFKQVVEIKALNWFLEPLKLLFLDLKYSPVYGAPGGSLRKCGFCGTQYEKSLTRNTLLCAAPWALHCA